MKKLTRLASIIFGLLILGSCSSTMYQSNWQSKPVVADGNPDEWSLPLRYSDSESGLQYNITNDDTNLYICIRATEQPIQMKILSSGMDIWLDPSGKNKETVGIQFPLPGKHGEKPKSENTQQDMPKGRNQFKKNMAEEYHLQKPQIALSGFKSEYNGTFLAADSKGVKASIDWNEQSFMTYELVVPFASFYSKEFNTLKDNSVIGFKININALSGQGSGSQAGGRQGGHPGGAGQGPGGGGGSGMKGGSGGGPGSGMGERPQSPDGQASSAMSSSTSIKFKVKLNGLIKK